MKVVLSPLGVYIARIVTMMLAMFALAPALFRLSPPEYFLGMVALGTLLGAICYAGDYSWRRKSGEETVLDFATSLSSIRFWKHVALTATLLSLVFLVFSRFPDSWSFSYPGWLSGTLLMQIASAGVKRDFADPYVSFRRKS